MAGSIRSACEALGHVDSPAAFEKDHECVIAAIIAVTYCFLVNAGATDGRVIGVGLVVVQQSVQLPDRGRAPQSCRVMDQALAA